MLKRYEVSILVSFDAQNTADAWRRAVSLLRNADDLEWECELLEITAEQINAEDPHDEDCPAVDGFGCRCGETV